MIVLIVSRPGPLADGLRALLTAIPRVTAIRQVNDIPAALPLLVERHPVLLILDSHLPTEAACTILNDIKVLSPETRTLILADDVRQEDAAQAAHADAVLLKGAPAEALFATIVSLLPYEDAT
jgi:DNA-binding NarL/FixJ family response regulator